MKNLSKAAIYAMAGTFTRLDSNTATTWDYILLMGAVTLVGVAFRQSAWWLFWGRA